MAHFAKIENGVVVNVIVAEQDFIDTQEGEWVQTSYNVHDGVYEDPLTRQAGVYSSGPRSRCNFAGIGMTYDAVRDKFYRESPQPYPSWTFNYDTGNWEAPIDYPNDGTLYDWDEDTQSWVAE